MSCHVNKDQLTEMRHSNDAKEDQKSVHDMQTTQIQAGIEPGTRFHKAI